MEVVSKVSKVRILSVVCLLLTALSMVSTVHANPFVARFPGVQVGESSLYDTWLDSLHYHERITVTGLTGATINFTRTEIDPTNDSNVFFAQQQSINLFCCGGQIPAWFIAGGLLGGDSPYSGDGRTLSWSLFGHILGGDHRQTLYTDSGQNGVVDHVEWDQQTGVMTKFLFEDSGSGWSVELLSTNAWGSTAVWTFMAKAVPVFWYLLPILAFISFMYFMTFFLAALKDWSHMRSLKAAKNGKMGGMQWMMIKTMVIASLIVTGILITALVILSLALR